MLVRQHGLEAIVVSLCVFFLFDSLRLIINLSVIKGRVFLGEPVLS